MYSVLINSYSFKAEDVQLLKDPTRENIFDAFEQIAKKVTSNDNLLVFYAGHGSYDEVKKQGYWYPSDAKKTKRATWITNDDIKEYLVSIPAKHTLLISDACFAGSIFKTRSIGEISDKAIKELYDLKSRKAMTSGALKIVPDKSVFIEYLIRGLTNSRAKYISSSELFYSLQIKVTTDSPNSQVPQFGEIRDAGDMGGDFIFIKDN